MAISRALYQVRCGNPYFKGVMHGVRFTPAPGGAVGMATLAQARKIDKEPNCSCPSLHEAAEAEETTDEQAEQGDADEPAGDE